jgi:hypothetical protein
VARGVGQEHRYLCVLDPPSGTGVPALHADGVRARLQIVGVIGDQHRCRVTQLVDHIPAHIVAHFVGVPDRLTE